MHLLFAGVGGAFAPSSFWQSQMVVVSDSGKLMLIDCGSDARHSLGALGITAADIDAVYVSHLHGDHVHGLEWLGDMRMFAPDAAGEHTRPTLYCHSDLSAPLWTRVLLGTMEHIGRKKTSLSDYFNVVPVTQSFVWEGLTIDLVRTHHVQKDDMDWTVSYGLVVRSRSSSIFISTDSAIVDYGDIATKASVIVHDCETTARHSGVHVHLDDIKRWPASVRRKTYLTHYGKTQPLGADGDGLRWAYPGLVITGRGREVHGDAASIEALTAPQKGRQ